jgi:alkylhydroperoxidase family enzyme
VPSLAVLQGNLGALAPRERALAGVAVTLTARPWAVTGDEMAQVRRQVADEQQLEIAVAVIAMFNYFTRVADATGIDFDYQTPLPAFKRDRDQVSATRPVAPRMAAAAGTDRTDAAGEAGATGRLALGHDGLRSAWASWREYLRDGAGPLGRPDRMLLARVAAEQAGDWASVEALGSAAEDTGHVLAGFARKLSREPWQMEAADLGNLRASGYSEIAILHAISVTAQQNAESRLSAGLAAAR